MLFAIISVFIASFYGVPSLTPLAHASTAGLVCITDQSVNPTDCPSSPAQLTGDVGSTITVAVNLQGAQPIIGLDIRVQANPAVLEPMSIILADSIMGKDCYTTDDGCRFVVERSTNPTSGISGLAMVILGQLSSTGTGNLFEIVYRVLSSTRGTPITFELGCGDSQNTPAGVCVDLVNPLKVPNKVPVAFQTADFGPVAPDFSMTAFNGPFAKPDEIAGPVTTPKSADPGFPTGLGIILGSLDGFIGNVNLSIAFTPICPRECPSSSLDSPTLFLSSGNTSMTVLNFLAPPEQFGTSVTYWNINITATSANLSHSELVTFKVSTPDLTLSSTDTGQWILGNATTTIVVKSIGGYGTINMTLTPNDSGCSNSTCPSWSLNSTSLALAPNSQNFIELTFSSSSNNGTVPLTYCSDLRATAERVSHTITICFTVAPRDFTLALDSSTLSIVRGGSGYVRARDSSWFPTSASVSTSPDKNRGPEIVYPYYTSCDPGSQHCYIVGPFVQVLTDRKTHLGAYTVTITVTNGWFTHTVSMTVNVSSPKH